MRDQGLEVVRGSLPDISQVDLGNLYTTHLNYSYHSHNSKHSLLLHTYEEVPGYLVFSSDVFSKSFNGDLYITLSSDYGFNYLKQNKAELDRIEWNDFEDVLRIETTHGAEAREILDPIAISRIYDLVNNSHLDLLRIYINRNHIYILSSMYGIESEKSIDYHEISTHKTMKYNVELNSQILSIFI